MGFQKETSGKCYDINEGRNGIFVENGKPVLLCSVIGKKKKITLLGFNECRVGLEEELDMLRVQAAMDRATVKELNLCLTEEHQGESICFFFFRISF